MRSLLQKIALFVLFIFQPFVYAQTQLEEVNLFTVVMPYGEELANNSKPANANAKTNQIDSKVQQAMQKLLFRLTGRPQLLESKLGQNYINNAKNWLANYHLKPRYEDGVAVGKNIHFKFDAHRIKSAFAKQRVQIWPLHMRPRTLIMGVFVQQGSLQKLTDETLNYRVDVDYRAHPESLRIPYMVAESRDNWVFPVDPDQNRSTIQEALLAADQQNLLSFKLISQPQGRFKLDWYLFNITSKVMNKSSVQGTDRQALFANMFEQVVHTFVKHSATQIIVKNQVRLNVTGLETGNLVDRMETELKAQQPMLSEVMLTGISRDRATFTLEHQGDLDVLKNWLQSWSMVNYQPGISEVGEQEFDLAYNTNWIPPEVIEARLKQQQRQEKLLKKQRSMQKNAEDVPTGNAQ